MKKLLSSLLVLAILSSLIVLPVPAETTGYSDDTVYYYSDYDSPSDIGALTENTASGVKPEIKTSTDGKSVLSLTRGTSVSGYKFASFNVAGSSATPIKIDNAPEVVVEYMARIASIGTSTYFGTNSAYLPTVTFKKGKIMSNQYAGVQLCTVTDGEWVKVTTVYSNKAETRDIYINGEFVKTTTTAEDNSSNVASANPYFKKGLKSIYVPFALYGNQGNSGEVDYLKVSAKPESFAAKILKTEEVSVAYADIKFNSSVKDADLIPANFKFTDGITETAVSDIRRIGDNTYRITPVANLETDNDYTLLIAIDKDMFGNDLLTESLSFKTSAEVEFVDGDELYYNTFDSELGFSGIVEVANEIVYGLDTSEDGLSIFKAQGTDVYQNGANYGFISPEISQGFGYNEVVLEYKIRVNADNPSSYMGTWSNLAKNWTKALDFARNEGTKDKLYFHYNDKTPIPGDYTFNPKEWNTITIVYPINRKSRDIYVNGEFIATSPEGDAENTYASKGSMHFAMLPDFRCSDDLLEVDYYKFTNITPIFDAKLINACSTSAIVKFNTTPANISAEIFALSDGTGISGIKAIDERTYMVSFTEPLAAGSYTLSLAGIKDTLGREISREGIRFTVATSPAEEIVYKNYQFEADAATEIEEIKTATVSRKSNFSTEYINAEDGKLVFTGRGDGSNASYMTIPKYKTTAGVRPDFVLEYKMNMTASSNGNYLTDDALRDAGDSKTLDISKKGIAWTRSDATSSAYLKTADELGGVDSWHTIALRYSSTNEVRTLYVDGVEVGTSPDTDTLADNYWSQKPYIYFTFKHYTGSSTTDNVKFEYIKTYSPADMLTVAFSGVSADLKTVYIDFNSTVADITPEMIKVGGQTPTSVEVYNDEEQIYALNFENKLKANTNYTLSVMGVKSSLAKECYDVLTFTTREADEVEVTATVNNSAAGTVAINGVEGTTAKAPENSDVVLTVKPYINYKATVTVNGKALFVDRFDKYTIRNITEDTDVSVEFTEVTEEDAAGQAIETIYNPYVDNISVYAFGVLTRNSNDFGVIVSSSKDNLTIEAVNAGNAQKFKADEANAFGEYGVRIIDVGKKLGSSVYMVPYAVYGETVVYGRALGASR